MSSPAPRNPEASQEACMHIVARYFVLIIILIFKDQLVVVEAKNQDGHAVIT
jgi:hypothetical protein